MFELVDLASTLHGLALRCRASSGDEHGDLGTVDALLDVAIKCEWAAELLLMEASEKARDEREDLRAAMKRVVEAAR